MNFSVVIPLYNKASHIKRAIDSIMSQTIKVNEIIVVDDGSTDRSAKIVQEMSNPIIKLLSQENQGPTTARNSGVKTAKNDLIAFLDADDEWLPDYLDNIRLLVNNFPDCGAYATSSYTIRPNGKIYYPDLSFIPPEPWIGIIPNIFTLLIHGLAFNSSSIVIPKKILTEIGGFPKNYYTGDIQTWVKIGVNFPIAINPKRKVVYHQEAINRTAPKHPKLDEYPVVSTIENMINNREIYSDELRNEAIEYIAKSRITVAINNIIAGERNRGIEILKKSRYTKRFKKKWIFWWYISHLPSGMPNFLLKLNSKIKKMKK